jgi:hypothetical protein
MFRSKWQEWTAPERNLEPPYSRDLAPLVDYVLDVFLQGAITANHRTYLLDLLRVDQDLFVKSVTRMQEGEVRAT